MGAFRNFPEEEIPDFFPDINWQHCQGKGDIVEASQPSEELQDVPERNELSLMDDISRIARFRSIARECERIFSSLLRNGVDERYLSSAEDTLRTLEDELNRCQQEIEEGAP